MKHLFMKFTAACFTLILITASVCTAFAADTLKINDAAEVNVGDKVKFTLNLSDTTEDIIGFELRLFFDSEYLELDKDSVSSSTFDNLFFNPDLDGRLPINWTDISSPADFSTKKEFLSCEFTVLKAGSADISYFVTEMYGDDMTYLKSYKWTYDISVNGEKVLSDGVLPVSEDEETLKNRQSSFINYVDGMGEENTPNKDNHEAIIGDKPTPATYNYYEQDVIEATRYENVESTDDSGSNPIIFIVIAIPVVGALVAVAIVLITKKNKKSVNKK